MTVRLIKLTKEYYNQLAEMIDEWKLDQEVNHTNHSPWAIFKNDYHDFDYYLENLELKEPKDGKVPDSVFFLLDEERNILLGAVNIRHYLNDFLLQYAGHIGDGIRPSERRKGYATEIIRLSLIECRKLGILKVLMVCDKSNIVSAKSIIKNGGVLENEFLDENGKFGEMHNKINSKIDDGLKYFDDKIKNFFIKANSTKKTKVLLMSMISSILLLLSVTFAWFVSILNLDGNTISTGTIGFVAKGYDEEGNLISTILKEGEYEEENTNDVFAHWVNSLAFLDRYKPTIVKFAKENNKQVVDCYNDMVVRILDKIELYLTVGNGIAK